MKLPGGYKKALGAVAAITAVALLALPFSAVRKEKVYVYTATPAANSEEAGFIRALKNAGVRVTVNETGGDANGIGFWFRAPEFAEWLQKSTFKQNFLYSAAYYPLDFKGIKRFPVMLTPFQALFEHYQRSNVLAATFEIGVNTADFYDEGLKRTVPVLYWSDNNKPSYAAEVVAKVFGARFAGNSWEPEKKAANGSAAVFRQAAGRAQIVVVFAPEGSAERKRAPKEALAAALSGALVFTTPNEVLEDLLGKDVVVYDSAEALQEKLAYWLKRPNEAAAKARRSAQKVRKKASSEAAARRFLELLNWKSGK